MSHKYVKEEDTFSTSANGTVPKPTAAEVSAGKYLKSNGTWGTPSGGGGGGSTVSITPTLQSGTKIADFEIDDVPGELYAPSGGGSEVEFTPTLSSGTKIGEIEIDGVSQNIYAPSGNQPQFYHFSGEVWNANTDSIKGRGSVNVTLLGGIARIDFDIKLTSSGTSGSEFAYGINSYLLQAAESRLPFIQPMNGGWWAYQYSSPDINYGSAFEAHYEYWTPARYYDSANPSAIGSWPANQFSSGTRIYGVCFGTYTAS